LFFKENAHRIFFEDSDDKGVVSKVLKGMRKIMKKVSNERGLFDLLVRTSILYENSEIIRNEETWIKRPIFVHVSMLSDRIKQFVMENTARSELTIPKIEKEHVINLCKMLPEINEKTFLMSLAPNLSARTIDDIISEYSYHEMTKIFVDFSSIHANENATASKSY